MSPLRLTIEDGKFRDAHGRHVLLRGINVAGDAKNPSDPDIPSYVPDKFFDGDNVKFHSRPFTVDEAHTHFARLKRYGYNTIRYIFTWEAIEAAGPGKYDEEWIQHTISVLRVAKEYDFYIFMDPHQDVWSRFSGGSGAPMWTLYACGLNPQGFISTQSALVNNTYPDPENFPKMIWSTNYNRLACQTIFTMWFAGKDFAPKCIIDGKNIQDYLQDHFMAACAHLARRIREAGDLEDDAVIGWESINEPNRGVIGYQDLSVVPSEEKNRLGTSPTVWQSILTGSGRACEVDVWAFGSMGPYKSGTELVDPHGEVSWLPADYDDSRYGWKRDPGWKLGECIWAQHGIWNPETDTLLKKDYFSKHPSTGKTINYEEFTNSYFMDFYRKFKDTIRAEHINAIMFCQPPVLELPPTIKGTADDDPRMVYAPHFYDGLTLMLKKWNRYWNVDVLGVLRGRYLSPAFAVRIGETAIRNLFKEELSAIIKEGQDNMGNHPCVLTEFGIPYDMNDKYAYKTGDYSSQSSAMDANHYAVEGSGMSGYTLWCYTAGNEHHMGDQWNGEDLSIYSLDDKALPQSAIPPPTANASSVSLDTKGKLDSSRYGSPASSTPENLASQLRTPSIASRMSSKNPELTNAPGYRAAEAFVRPAPSFVSGTIVSYGFDLKTCVFTLTLETDAPPSENTPTEISLPEYHFPSEKCVISVSSGKWSISTDELETEPIQKFKWWHPAGRHTVSITGVVSSNNRSAQEEEGYYEQCQQTACAIM